MIPFRGPRPYYYCLILFLNGVWFLPLILPVSTGQWPVRRANRQNKKAKCYSTRLINGTDKKYWVEIGARTYDVLYDTGVSTLYPTEL